MLLVTSWELQDISLHDTILPVISWELKDISLHDPFMLPMMSVPKEGLLQTLRLVLSLKATSWICMVLMILFS